MVVTAYKFIIRRETFFLFEGKLYPITVGSQRVPASTDACFMQMTASDTVLAAAAAAMRVV